MSYLIGLAGYRGSGKTTAANRLITAHGFTLVKFAGPLKDMLRVLGLTDEHLNGSLKEVPTDLLMGRTPRHAMQTLGTEWGRDCIGRTFWLETAMRRVDELRAEGSRVVIDDLRFPNENKAIQQAGGVTCRINRAAGVDDLHASETHIPDLDVNTDIKNHWSIEALCQQIDELVEQLEGWEVTRL